MSEPTQHIASLRKSYERAELNEEASHADPLQQFDQWIKEAIAAEVPEPNAMTVATVAANGRPSTRVVLIKGYDERGIVWYTNYESRKGQELAANPFAALQFHWVELERVVRIEGRVEKVSAEESDEYFHSRPLDSRIGAWASPQSQVISGRSVLVANAAKYGAKFLLQPPRPPHWGGYRLKPDNWQFWQGRKSRLHDRLRYTQVEAGWLRERLAP
ncbi:MULTISPECIES: pyridoxamine 5'-phosphate oxidase [unclassified Polaromonas]|jgi:pyridoxamine 5'-phosphate oxidase|uniref:pyridoxamine 5'-phosphate oxidase n=1 Tax=unclassified Polaromonas TaxID=2638319 RepID=UPI000BDDB923|nr:MULTISPECIES: pyridoxamine 5'-phosphate oxidase [unclassified Polaromonas]OYY36609.1 MAG: pyridoxamine 5'-phosphate oxidase [Polaromonas sp. 35-63-35]OYZ18752.1 MAG: pyridoxamine 5'-phosphate oxidase [Polaromonas sp. 16-63-31]OYZ80943.1 MAG: pyridoxamine 5'-phosphate oxidase [Polaromonas sp. 24-63-21]OZA52841.1 MAG: pyridoxamine 5'-phosphate oxidase [Polaromonas sp. 17-63-33]OZA88307.1 MAG: pyridoxamine 5'-phosphate oxidase [Polaromonas sp. 39-63-25]